MSTKTTDPSKLTVVITGASTGIGHGLALSLAKDGHQVFASVRRPADAQRLRDESEGLELIPLEFDVTDDVGVRAGAERVRAERKPQRPLCLINNAGIAVAGPIETLKVAELRRQFEVNVFAAVSVTQAYLPMIRESGGRIVNISSVSGLVTSPFLGAYSASKFALEAISDALRRELAAEGIKVVLIEPGPVQTPIWEKGFEETDMSKVEERYRKPLESFSKGVKRSVKSAISVEPVVDAVRAALLDEDPSVRKIVTSTRSRIEVELSRRIPTKWLDKFITNQFFR